MSPLADGSADPALPQGLTPVGSGHPTEPSSPTPDPVAGEDDKRRYPSTIGGAFYLAILGTTIAAIVVVTTGHWRGGLHWLAGALLAGAVLRAVLPERDAGMLAVRNRWLDTSLLLVFGGVLWFLTSSLPSAAP